MSGNMLSLKEGPGAGAALAIGAMDLAGWAYGVPELVTVLPGYPAPGYPAPGYPGMVPQTALSLILSSLALLVLPRLWRVAAALGQHFMIVLTTSLDAMDIESCYQAGANTYVHKPVAMTGFIESMQRLADFWFRIAVIPKS